MKKFQILLYTFFSIFFISFNALSAFDIKEEAVSSGEAPGGVRFFCAQTGWTATPADGTHFEEFQETFGRCNPNGLPAPEKLPAWYANLQKRREMGNEWNIYQLTSPEGHKLYVSFGVMPTRTPYKPVEHHDILKTFISLGIIRHVDQAAQTFEQKALERVDERGLAIMLPFFPRLDPEVQSVGEYSRLCTQSFGFCAAIAQHFAMKKALLPREVAQAYRLIALLSPVENLPLILFAQQAGFEVIENKWFKEFYGDPRAMLVANLFATETSANVKAGPDGSQEAEAANQ